MNDNVSVGSAIAAGLSLETLPIEVKHHIFSYLLNARKTRSKGAWLTPPPHHRFHTAILSVNRLLGTQASEYMQQANSFVLFECSKELWTDVIGSIGSVPIISNTCLEDFPHSSLQIKMKLPLSGDTASKTQDQADVKVLLAHEDLPSLVRILQLAFHRIPGGHILVKTGTDGHYHEKEIDPETCTQFTVLLPTNHVRSRFTQAESVDIERRLLRPLSTLNSRAFQYEILGGLDPAQHDKMCIAMQRQVVSLDAVGWNLFEILQNLRTGLDDLLLENEAMQEDKLLAQAYQDLAKAMSAACVDQLRSSTMPQDVNEAVRSWQLALTMLAMDCCLTAARIFIRVSDHHSAWHCIEYAFDVSSFLLEWAPASEHLQYWLAVLMHHQAIRLSHSSNHRDEILEDDVLRALVVADSFDSTNTLLQNDFAWFEYHMECGKGDALDFGNCHLLDYGPVITRFSSAVPPGLRTWRGSEAMLPQDRVDRLEEVCDSSEDNYDSDDEDGFQYDMTDEDNGDDDDEDDDKEMQQDSEDDLSNDFADEDVEDVHEDSEDGTTDPLGELENTFADSDSDTDLIAEDLPCDAKHVTQVSTPNSAVQDRAICQLDGAGDDFEFSHLRSDPAGVDGDDKPAVQRPVFGPPRPPHLLNNPIRERKTKMVSDMTDDEYPPNNGKWYPSRGYFQNAPEPKPYSMGGSPFQAMSRRINGQYELACKVDPQYLLDTGMTEEQAMTEPMAQFRSIFGGMPGDTPEQNGQIMKDLFDNACKGGVSDPEDMDQEACARALGNAISNSDIKNRFMRSMANTSRSAGGVRDDFKTFETTLAETLGGHRDAKGRIRPGKAATEELKEDLRTHAGVRVQTSRTRRGLDSSAPSDRFSTSDGRMDSFNHPNQGNPTHGAALNMETDSLPQTSACDTTAAVKGDGRS